MEGFFALIFYILLFTVWLWPAMFVSSLLAAIKKIGQGEDYGKERGRAIAALIVMAITPFVIALVATS